MAEAAVPWWAALLNAHKNIVFSNELHALRFLASGLDARELYYLIRFDSCRSVRQGSRGGGGYRYAVPGQWQGAHGSLHVLGDRKAGATARYILENPDVLETLRSKIGVNIKFLNVIRNPFDNITTGLLKARRPKDSREEEHLLFQIEDYFWRFGAIDSVVKSFGEDKILHLYSEALIADPTRELSKICDFLEVDLDTDYLHACSQIVFRDCKRTRSLITWPEELVKEVERRIREVPLLTSAGYAFRESNDAVF